MTWCCTRMHGRWILASTTTAIENGYDRFACSSCLFLLLVRRGNVSLRPILYVQIQRLKEGGIGDRPCIVGFHCGFCWFGGPVPPLLCRWRGEQRSRSRRRHRCHRGRRGGGR